MVVNTTPSIGSNHSVGDKKKSSSSSTSPAATNASCILPLQAAESQDVDDNINKNKPTMNIFQQLLFNMNPVQCLSPSVVARCSNPLADDDDDDNDNNNAAKNRSNLEKQVPPLLKDLEHEGKLRTTALQKLYRMTDKDNQKNRVPVVCSESFDTLRALLPCLSPNCAAHDRRQALLLLNNLCIPMENKKYILCGNENNNDIRDEILPALLRIFKKRLAESFLSAACLFNLSFYEPSKYMLLNYIPPLSFAAPSSGTIDEDDDDESEVPSGYKCHKAPSDNEKSLLRVVEALLMDFTPYLQKQMEHELKQQQQKAASSSPSPTSPRHSYTTKPVSTVEAATTRWCIAMLRNLATVPENAQIIATTTAIPLLTAHCLIMSTSALPQQSGSADNVNAAGANDLSHWARDSLEDSSLMLLLWLSQCGSQGLGTGEYNNNSKPIDLDESVDHGSSSNNNNDGNHSVTSVEQQSALEALDLPVIRQALQGIQNKPGIHGVRAKVILQRMNEAVNHNHNNNHQQRASPTTMTKVEQNHEKTNVRVIVTTNSDSDSSNHKPTNKNHHHHHQQQRQQRSADDDDDDEGACDSSQVGFDTDVVQEIIKTVESHRLLANDDDNDDDGSYDADRMRVDNITLASF